MKPFSTRLFLLCLVPFLVACGSPEISNNIGTQIIPDSLQEDFDALESELDTEIEIQQDTEVSETTDITFNNPNTMLKFKTSHGDIEMELFMDQAPQTTKNFLLLARDEKYNGVPFHRVIEGFMIQGGDFENGNGTGGYAYGGGEIDNEIIPGQSHDRGTISMANRGPDTNGSQFFIVHQDSPFLDGGYSVFGRVTKGMDIVDAIASTPTDRFDTPLEPVMIQKVEIKKEILEKL